MSQARLLGTLLLVLFAALACARAPASVTERARAIEGQVWSPYCPGRLLIDCTTEQARGLRAKIRSRIVSGDSDAHVLRWIRADFGDEILARPQTSGSGLVLWLIPAVVFAAGAVTVVTWVRRSSRAAAKSPARDL